MTSKARQAKGSDDFIPAFCIHVISPDIQPANLPAGSRIGLIAGFNHLS
jgi:hypothetical protein